MKKTLTTSDIARELHEDKNATWSWSGAIALAEYLEELERDSGEEMELNVVATRCDWAEYASLADWAVEYFGGWDLACERHGASGIERNEESEDDMSDDFRSYIQDNGTLIEFDGGIVVSSF